MSRNGAGVYSLPGTYEATPGETILASQHNDPLEDLQQDANTPRPVVAGGTGSTTEQGAIDAFFATARTIKDDKLLIVDPSDTTKRVRIDAGNVTAGQTRILTMADGDIDLANLYTIGQIDSLLAKVATDDIQTQEISSRVSAVDFTIPATGNMFLLLATNLKVYLDAAIGFRTSADGTTFAAGSTDYETRYMVNYTSTPTGGGSQGAQGYLHSGTQEADGVSLIGAAVMGLLMPGDVGAWPTVLSIGGGYNYGGSYDVGMTYNVRRSAGRIAKFRIIAGGTDLVQGRFALIRIRGA